MTSPNLRGADVLAQTLLAGGVRRIFTLSGNHIMPIFDACLDAGIELLHVRHEAAAVHMADAWARLTGEVGVAMVTGGPGHANAVSALYTAAMAESPVLLLSGHAPTDQLGRGAFQEMRQAEIAAPLCKSSDTGADVAKAFRIARSGRPGPVHLSVPNDLLDARVDAMPPRHDFAPAPGVPPAAEIEARMAQLFAARRPLVICSPACMTRRGRERMAALEAASGIPVVGMESPRGVNDPSLGAFAEVLAQADRVLLVGKKPDFTLKFGQAFGAGCDVLAMNGDEVDAVGALEALARVAGRADAGWLRAVREAVAYRPWRAGKPVPSTARVLEPLQALLDAHPESVLVSDGGEIGQWAQACLHAPHRVINGVAGSIGAALPFALAARVFQPEAPVLAVMGDGTFGFHPAEIDTAVRYRLPFVCVVGNDARWNAEYQIQVRDYGRDRTVGCELLPTRYDQVAVAFGGWGEAVDGGADVLAAAQRALASGKPAVLNVAIEGLPAPNLKRA